MGKVGGTILLLSEARSGRLKHDRREVTHRRTCWLAQDMLLVVAAPETQAQIWWIGIIFMYKTPFLRRVSVSLLKIRREASAMNKRPNYTAKKWAVLEIDRSSNPNFNWADPAGRAALIDATYRKSNQKRRL